MGSFQQVVMGGICLVAAFWFGSYINEQPGAQQYGKQSFADSIPTNSEISRWPPIVILGSSRKTPPRYVFGPESTRDVTT